MAKKPYEMPVFETYPVQGDAILLSTGTNGNEIILDFDDFFYGNGGNL